MNHMLINDLVGLLLQVPPMLAAQWGGWFCVGLILSIWGRREKMRLIVHGPAPRQKSGVRPPSGVRVAEKKAAKSVPVSNGDAFGELEALLDTPAGTHRTPGDLPAPQALP